MYIKEFTIKSYETATSKCLTLSTPSPKRLFLTTLGQLQQEASEFSVHHFSLGKKEGGETEESADSSTLIVGPL